MPGRSKAPRYVRDGDAVVLNEVGLDGALASLRTMTTTHGDLIFRAHEEEVSLGGAISRLTLEALEVMWEGSDLLHGLPFGRQAIAQLRAALLTAFHTDPAFPEKRQHRPRSAPPPHTAGGPAADEVGTTDVDLQEWTAIDYGSPTAGADGDGGTYEETGRY